MLSRVIACAAVLSLAAGGAGAQPAPDPLVATAAQLRDRALTDPTAWTLLESLTTEIGARPAGSAALLRAADWGQAQFKRLGFDRVSVDEFPVSGWTRGAETAEVTAPSPQKLSITALGSSVATPAGGITAQIAVFRDFDDLLAQPPGSLRGKIVVVTERMVRAQDGAGYGFANRIRRVGAVEAARRGAVAYMHRSLGTDTNRTPHTGAMNYAPAGPSAPPQIPAAALSAPDAELLEHLAERGAPVTVKLTLTPTVRRNAVARTVIGEITGRERPDEIVAIGGHLDSWDLGTGAIDDASGVAITTAAAKIIAGLPQRPRRTIRVVMFGAEEIGSSGDAYLRQHPADAGRTVAAIESDFGADRIYAVSLPKGAAGTPFAARLTQVLGPLGIMTATQPAKEAGADFGPSVAAGVPPLGLSQDGTRYFDWHHTANDTLDKIDRAQLDQNVAAWAAAVYLIADSDVDFRALAATAPAPVR